MERVSSTETVLLTYSPQKPFMTTPKSPLKNSDIDFNDVFGGPPRRSSMQETTYSLTHTRHSFAKDDEKSSGRSSWSGLSEKPVFGEEGTNRRYPSEDFFDDIFRGNESVTSSPRKHDITTPGSPKVETFGSSPSGKFSLPAKLTKGKDIPVFGSSTRNSYSQSPLSRFSNEGQDDSRNGLQSSSLESPLWLKLSPSSRESSNPDETDLKKNFSISPQDIVNSGQFHFSIYKWASKGVPLVLPLRGGTSSRHKEVKFERRLSERVSHGSSQITTDSFRMTFNDLLNEPEPCQIVEETIVPTFENKPEKNTVEVVLNTALENTKFAEKTMKIPSETPEDAQKESKSQISSLFVNDNEQQQQEGVYQKGGGAKEKGSTAKSFKKSSSREIGKSVKKPDGERTALDSREKEKMKSGDQQGMYEKTGDPKGKQSTTKSSKKPSSRETSMTIKKPDAERNSGAEEKTSRDTSGNDAKGKVKDFIKIFNQEAPSKRKIGNDPQSQSLRWKEKGTSKIESEVNVSSNEAVEGKLASMGHKVETTPDRCSPVMGQPEQQFTTTTKYVSIDTGTSSQKKETSESSTSSIPVDSKTVVVDTDEMFDENFEVKELTQDENKSPQKVDDVEDMQRIETKIRQWAFGKEGNIRSLLSTLQYVLWTGSGWKPVPLMDIIEGNAVRKAYQRALLCLHPDKLQQKGAASYQRHIAEKVFDILQDAWTHFNSLGSL